MTAAAGMAHRTVPDARGRRARVAVAIARGRYRPGFKPSPGGERRNVRRTHGGGGEMKHLRRGLALCIAILACALPAAASATPNYVSLGDSYTAGPFIPVWIPPWGCLKSDHNYSHLSAPDIGLALHDPSCSGAETEDMTQTQGVSPEPNPPQFNAIDADTQVITLGI